MAKQPPKQPVKHPVHQQKKSPVRPAGFNSFSYLWRNLLIAAAFGFLFLGIDKMNEKGGQFNQLYNEFVQLRRSNQNPERQQELYNELMEIQGDTSWLKKLTRGYYFAVHDVAIGGKDNVEEIEDKETKPLTRDDKFAMRVGIWPLIDYINKNTPPNAVILLPAGDSAVSNNGKWNYIYDPEWMEYFIYPRLCVSMGYEQGHPDLAKRANYVVIIEGKGYDKLKYNVPVEQRVQEAVLPIDHPPVQNAPAQDSSERNPFQNKQ